VIYKKILNVFLLPFRQRYNIFTGTNTFLEWSQMLFFWISPKSCPQSTISVYENTFAKSTNTKHGISFGAGRMALYAVLEALDINDGDEVVIPAFTCVVVPNAILYRGAVPVYVDINISDFNIDVSKIEEAITPKTKALYAQHTFGVVCDVDAIRKIAIKYNIPIIEDAAHALGAKYNNRLVGSLTEVSFCTSDHSKIINSHLGGIALTNNDEIAMRLRAIQEDAPFLDVHSIRKIIGTFLVEYICFHPRLMWIGKNVYAVLFRLKFLYYFLDEQKIEMPQEYPFPCRLSAVQAKLGLSQLNNLDMNLAHRRNIAGYLDRNIGWYKFDEDEINRASWLRYSFLVKDRSKFESAFKESFDLGVWFTSVVSGRTNDLHLVSYTLGSCPVAEYVCQHIVNFPTHLRVPLRFMKREVGGNLKFIKAELKRKSSFSR